jgi:hypothetical protein
VFAKFEKWLTAIVDALKGSSIKVDPNLERALSPGMATVFNEMLGGTKPKPPNQDAAQAGQAKARFKKGMDALRERRPGQTDEDLEAAIQHAMGVQQAEYEISHDKWQAVPADIKRFLAKPDEKMIWKGKSVAEDVYHEVLELETWRDLFGQSVDRQSGPDWTAVNEEIRNFVREGKPVAPQEYHESVLNEAERVLDSWDRKRAEGDEGEELEDGFDPASFAEDEDETRYLFMGAPVSVDRLLTVVKSGTSHLVSILKKKFRPRGNLPKSVFKAKIAMEGYISRQEREVAYVMRDWRKEIKKSYPDGFQHADQIEVNDVLRGEADILDLPEGMRPIVERMRGLIDGLSRALISSGAIEGDLVLTVEENEGMYLNRSYRVFDDPRWASKVLPQTINQAKAFIRSQYPELNENQVAHKINTLLFEGKAVELGSAIGALSSGILGAKDLSILKRKKGIPVEIRELWGEYEDADVNFTRSATKIARLIANHKFLETVKQDGMGVFLFTGEEEDVNPEAKTRISAEGNPRMEPLDGLYTFPDVKRAFQDLYKPNTDGPGLRLWYILTAASKVGKTVLNLITHPRNFSANSFFAIANGNYTLGGLGASVKAVASDIGILSDEKWRDYYLRLVELGIVGESTHAGEVRDTLRDVTRTRLDDVVGGIAVRFTKKLYRGAAIAYQAEDDFWKVHAFEAYKKRYRKAYPNLSEAKLEEKVAEIIRDTMPTYSMVPEIVRDIRRMPVGSFVSFPAESIRVTWNQFRLMENEIKSENPELRKIGRQRLIGMLFVASALDALALGSQYLIGLIAGDDDDMREFFAPWSDGSTMLYVPNIISSDPAAVQKAIDAGHLVRVMGPIALTFDRTNPTTIDLSYLDPYSITKKPLKAFLAGKSWDESFVKSATHLFDPFVSEEILAAAVLDAARNKKGVDGRKVYNDQLSGDEIALEIMQHLAKAMEPGVSAHARKLGKALAGETEIHGKAYTIASEGAAVMTGIRMATTDIRQALSFDASDYSRDMQEASGLVRSALRRRGVVSDAAIEKGFNQTTKARQKLHDTMHRKVQAARNLGVPDSEIKSILSDNGISKAGIKGLLENKPEPYRISASDLMELPADRRKTFQSLQRAAGHTTGYQQRKEQTEAVGRLAYQATYSGDSGNLVRLAREARLKLKQMGIREAESRRSLERYMDDHKHKGFSERAGRL